MEQTTKRQTGVMQRYSAQNIIDIISTMEYKNGNLNEYFIYQTIAFSMSLIVILTKAVFI